MTDQDPAVQVEDDIVQIPGLEGVLTEGEQETIVALFRGDDLPQGGFWMMNLRAGGFVDDVDELNDDGKKVAETLSSYLEGNHDGSSD